MPLPTYTLTMIPRILVHLLALLLHGVAYAAPRGICLHASSPEVPVDKIECFEFEKTEKLSDATRFFLTNGQAVVVTNYRNRGVILYADNTTQPTKTLATYEAQASSIPTTRQFLNPRILRLRSYLTKPLKQVDEIVERPTITQQDGTVLKGCRATKLEGSLVTIVHTDGIKKINLADLSVAMQTALNIAALTNTAPDTVALAERKVDSALTKSEAPKAAPSTPLLDEQDAGLTRSSKAESRKSSSADPFAGDFVLPGDEMPVGVAASKPSVAPGMSSTLTDEQSREAPRSNEAGVPSTSEEMNSLSPKGNQNQSPQMMSEETQTDGASPTSPSIKEVVMPFPDRPIKGNTLERGIESLSKILMNPRNAAIALFLMVTCSILAIKRLKKKKPGSKRTPSLQKADGHTRGNLIRFRCPHCSVKISAESEQFGLTTSCPSCGGDLVVPADPAQTIACPPQHPLNRSPFGNLPPVPGKRNESASKLRTGKLVKVGILGLMLTLLIAVIIFSKMTTHETNNPETVQKVPQVQQLSHPSDPDYADFRALTECEVREMRLKSRLKTSGEYTNENEGLANIQAIIDTDWSACSPDLLNDSRAVKHVVKLLANEQVSPNDYEKTLRTFIATRDKLTRRLIKNLSYIKAMPQLIDEERSKISKEENYK